MLAPFLFQPDGVGKNRQRIGLSQIGDCIKASPGQQLVDFGFGGGGKSIADLFHDSR
jgi:hypothetical protein